MQHLKNQPSAAQRTANERRAEPRRAGGGNVAILPFDSAGGFTEAEILDFSIHGICLGVSDPIDIGTEFILKTTLDHTTLLVYVVRNCVKEDARFRVGSEFVEAVGSPGEDGQDTHARFIEELEAQATAQASA